MGSVKQRKVDKVEKDAKGLAKTQKNGSVKQRKVDNVEKDAKGLAKTDTANEDDDVKPTYSKALMIFGIYFAQFMAHSTFMTTMNDFLGTVVGSMIWWLYVWTDRRKECSLLVILSIFLVETPSYQVYLFFISFSFIAFRWQTLPDKNQPLFLKYVHCTFGNGEGVKIVKPRVEWYRVWVNTYWSVAGGLMIYILYTPGGGWVWSLFRCYVAATLPFLSLVTLNLVPTFICGLFGVHLEDVKVEPFKSNDLREFWGTYWNPLFQRTLRRVVYLPLRKWAGNNFAAFMTFFWSGAYHTLPLMYLGYIGYCNWNTSLYIRMMSYFILQYKFCILNPKRFWYLFPIIPAPLFTEAILALINVPAEWTF